jgi:polysaccharide pyruvyl transferase WcaK-like protein
MPRHAIIASGDLHNVGDLALLLQCAHGLRSWVGVERISVRQWGATHPDTVRQLRDADIDVINGRSMPSALWKSRGALVLIGGGQMVRDNSSLASLGVLEAMMTVARHSGGDWAIMACGVDQLDRSSHRRLWARLMKAACLVTVRDGASQMAVQENFGSRQGSTITADLAFCPSPLHTALQTPSAPESVVVAPCVDHSEGRTITRDALVETAINACAVLGVRRISILAHDARPGMDLEVCAGIASAIAARDPGMELNVVSSVRLSEYVKIYSSSVLTITNRLHSVIFSCIGERPVLVLNDGTKKLQDAAFRFSIPMVSGTQRLSKADLVAALDGQADGAGRRRSSELQVAKEASRTNFDLLKTQITYQA